VKPGFARGYGQWRCLRSRYRAHPPPVHVPPGGGSPRSVRSPRSRAEGRQSVLTTSLTATRSAPGARGGAPPFRLVKQVRPGLQSGSEPYEHGGSFGGQVSSERLLTWSKVQGGAMLFSNRCQSAPVRRRSVMAPLVLPAGRALMLWFLNETPRLRSSSVGR
jgi:hypothetical protein